MGIMKKIIIIALSLAIIVGFLFWKFGPNLLPKGPAGPVELTYWGLWEEDGLMRPLILQFENQNPNVKVNYVRQSSVNYKSRVQTQVREGTGPDVFRIHNSWIPMFAADLYPAPADIFTLDEYKNTFYPVATDSLVKANQILAAPMEIDGLALYYNEEILSGVGGQAPKSWQEFIDTAVKMTVKDQSGQIQTAGAALGTAGNVDHFSDILGLLILQQPGATLENPASSQVAEVMRFYTGFVTDPRKKTWDVNLPKSTDMFASGRLGFYFAPSWRAHEIRVMNPNLKFKIAPVPQLKVAAPVAWASFWVEAVSKNSKNPKEAWQFVKFLTSSEAEKLFYQEAAKIRLFGEPYSRVDLAGDLANDPIAGAYVAQGPYYKSWYLSSKTMDGGINDEIIKYFEDAVNATLAGGDPQGALQTVASGVKQVLDKYARVPAPTEK